MAENVSLITWMANLQIRFLTWRRGELVGADRFGNRYFRERKARNGKRERRWVLYAGESDASRVPPEWRGWLHHTSDQPLPEGESPDRHPWRREYEPNASGTLRAYRPSGHAAAGGQKMRATGDYEFVDATLTGTVKREAGMRRNMIETVLGAVVLAVAGFFLVFAYTSADLRRVQGYDVSAGFSSIAGLANGSDVRISGVKVGTVSELKLDPTTYQAIVHMTIDPQVKLPVDTAAIVASESLLGGKFLSLDPGGDEAMIKPGGRIARTRSTPGFEQLLGQVIYSLQNVGKQGGGDAGAAKP